MGGREAQEAKARGYLADGKVSVLTADLEAGTAHFEVTGSSETPYNTLFSYGSWVCDCPARANPCAHVLACMHVCALRSADSPSLAPAQARDAQVDELLAMSLAGTETGRAALAELRADPALEADVARLMDGLDL